MPDSLDEPRTNDLSDPETVRPRFVKAWQDGERPEIEAYLPPSEDGKRDVLADLLEIDLNQRLRAGEEILVEAYLQRFPQVKEQPTQVLRLIEAEFAHRQAKGDVLIADYLDRFPEYADELKERLSLGPEFAATLPPRAQGLKNPFGRYELIRKLGQGGMGEVYLARDAYLQRTVALKVPTLPFWDTSAVDRFLREARAAAALHHPHLCPVFEAGAIDGTPYYTMAFIEGQSLSRQYQLPMPPRQAAELTKQLALALAEAHAKGVVHRDLKPGNIHINQRGEPIILDFGLALRTTPDDIRSSLPGAAMGTPAYMAPEQARGDMAAMGPCCDVYSLGVILYELLTNRLPFSGSVQEVLAQVIAREPPPPTSHRPDLDRHLERICLKAMAKRLVDRIASMAEFAAALCEWLDPKALAPEAPTAKAEVDPRFADETLGLIRDWGWEKSLELLRERIRDTTDAVKQAGLRLLVGWLAGERGRDDESMAQFRDAASSPGLSLWAHVGEAFVAMRQKKFAAARLSLAKVATTDTAADTTLSAAVAHLRGTVAFHEGKLDEASADLHSALETLGPDHFASGRILDSLGMLHAARNRFTWALEFYTLALALKRRFGDDAGVAVAHGQLGRLHLSWNRLAEADRHFREGLDVTRRIGDERGEAQLYNHRAQVFLLQGRSAEAEALLDETIRSAEGRWTVIEGYARKDRAMAYLPQGKFDDADSECDRSDAIFLKASFPEGAVHVMLVRAQNRRAQGRHEEAIRLLWQATARFEQMGELALAALTSLELAQTLKARGAVLAVEALKQALGYALKSRREHLVVQAETELREVAPRELLPRPEEMAAVEEAATVLALELREEPPNGDTPLSRFEKIRDLLAEFELILADRGIDWIESRPDGLLAIVRGRQHRDRAEKISRSLATTLDEFNRPRRILGLPLWQVHQMLASGHIGFAWDSGPRRFTRLAVGFPVAQAIRLLADAKPGVPTVHS